MSTKEESEIKTQEKVDLDDLLDGTHSCLLHLDPVSLSPLFCSATDALDDFADEVSATQASEISNVKQEAAATAAATQDSEDDKLQEVMEAVNLEDSRVMV